MALRNFKSDLLFALILPTFKPHFLAFVPRASSCIKPALNQQHTNARRAAATRLSSPFSTTEFRSDGSAFCHHNNISDEAFQALNISNIYVSLLLQAYKVSAALCWVKQNVIPLGAWMFNSKYSKRNSRRHLHSLNLCLFFF